MDEYGSNVQMNGCVQVKTSVLNGFLTICMDSYAASASDKCVHYVQLVVKIICSIFSNTFEKLDQQLYVELHVCL